MTWGFPALLPIRQEGVLRIFIALKNPSPWPGFEPDPLSFCEKCIQNFSLKSWWEVTAWEDINLVWRITLEIDLKEI
jgi:hypothetical protein